MRFWENIGRYKREGSIFSWTLVTTSVLNVARRLLIYRQRFRFNRINCDWVKSNRSGLVAQFSFVLNSLSSIGDLFLLRRYLDSRPLRFSLFVALLCAAVCGLQRPVVVFLANEARHVSLKLRQHLLRLCAFFRICPRLIAPRFHFLFTSLHQNKGNLLFGLLS